MTKIIYVAIAFLLLFIAFANRDSAISIWAYVVLLGLVLTLVKLSINAAVRESLPIKALSGLVSG